MVHTFAALVALASLNSPLPIFDDAWDPRDLRAPEDRASADVSADRARAQSIVLGIEAYAATRATSDHEAEHAALLVTLTIRPEVWLWMTSALAVVAAEADVDLEAPTTDRARLAALALCGCSARRLAP